MRARSQSLAPEHFRDETAWLRQKALAELLDVGVPAIAKHLKNIFYSGELQRNRTVSILEIVQPEGGREIKRPARTMPNMADALIGSAAEAELAGFFAKFAPAVAKLGKALRAKLRARLPGLTEVVYFYENQHSLVISWSPTGRGFDGVCSIALSPRGVLLHFGRGAELSKADPLKLLQGTGKTVRHVVLNSPADFDRPEIQALLTAALKLAKLRPAAGAKGATFSRAAAQHQRARRAKKSAKPAPARRKAATKRKPKR